MNKLLILAIILITLDLSAQEKLTYEKLDKLDRVTTIRLAKKEINKYLTLLGDTSFNYSLIDTIRVYKNKKKYFVRFEQIIKYAPLNSNYYYGLDVDLLNNDIHRILVLNQDSASTNVSFYHPNSQDIEKIKFIKKALGLNEVYESIIIREKQDYYDIGYGSSGEKVKKITGNIYDQWDEIIYVPDDERLVETKIH
ncbi:hypothetical protein J8L85_13430 [Maribacter sp. MMG018]|uniref:hypothetical protein n=1 Tax=Maribacter sp. MMG018 TaxID=2822688 RepID=UPI001B35ADCF|nr:hypothetical protein [Maribacter sp. MMG018]MBQ4915450.1 hypothetical protein [Maribacter sp. MMG018]